MITLNGKFTDAVIHFDEVEQEAQTQIYDIINSEIAQGLKVRIMPDVHAGKGICIGFSMELGKYLSAKWVGVDIGCGMLAGKFKAENMDLVSLNEQIKSTIPMGFNIHSKPIVKKIDFSQVQKTADIFIQKFNQRFGTAYLAPTYNEKWLTERLKTIGMPIDKLMLSLGTLGGGNHFIELGISDLGDYWVTIHCGSRNLGVKICDYWTNVAEGKVKVSSKEYTDEYDYIINNTVPKSDINVKLKELKLKYGVGIKKEYITGDDLIGYLFDMIFAQHYADWNRQAILGEIQKILKVQRFEQTVSTIHNYIDFHDFIIRKGSISSYTGQSMVIPFNQKDGLLICEGKSNADWNYSAPHGAGRIMSRSKAKSEIKLEDVQKSMEGIYTTSVCESTIDESVFAYKDSELIEIAIEPTATIIERVKPIMNIKDTGKQQSWKEKKKEAR